MADEFKTLRDSLFKVLTGTGRGQSGGLDEGDDDERAGVIDASMAKALIGAVFARACKSKDEVVQIVARELGNAVAAMLKEPLSQLAKNQKLQISFEFVPKEEAQPKVHSRGQDVPKARKKSGARRTAAATKRSSHKKKAGNTAG